MVGRKLLAVLILLSLYLFFSFNGQLLITDSVESNYALTSKEMAQSGDWVSPQIYGNYWYDKPVFFYWLTASAFKLLGDFNEFAARFWPAVAGVFSVLLIYWFGKKLYSPQVGLISGFIAATSFEFWVIAKSVITDMPLFLFFNGALAFFYLAYRGKGKEKNYYYLFYLLCGLATLTKGPIGFLLPGLILTLFFLWTRNWSELKEMKIFSGALVFLLTAVPWYYAMYLAHGKDYLEMFFGTHNFLRATVSEHPEHNVFYFYFVMLLVGFFPWVAFLPQALRDSFKKEGGWKNLSQETVFLLIWAVAIIGFFQLMATKYVTYTFPSLFPLAILVGRFLSQEYQEPRNKLFWPMVYVFFFSFLYVIAGGVVLQKIDLPLSNLLPLVLLLIGGSGYCLYLAWQKKNQRFFMVLLITTLLFNTFLIKDVLVPLTGYRSAKGVAVKVEKHWEPGTIVGAYGDYQTSSVFYSGKKIYRVVREAHLVDLKPKAFSWSIKNVMPFMALEDLEKEDQVLIILNQEDYEKFLAEKIGNWKIIEEQGKNYLLEKI